MKKLIFTFLLITQVMIAIVTAQNPDKKLIDYTVFDSWKSLRGIQISEDAKWVTYEINPQAGDGNLIIYQTSTGKTDTIKRGYDAAFSTQGNYLVFKIKPKHQLIRQAKIDKKKDNDFPKDSLAIYDLNQSKIVNTSGNIKSFAAFYESNLLAVHHTFIKYIDPPLTKKQIKKKVKPTEIKSDGFYFEIYTKMVSPAIDPSAKKSKKTPAPAITKHTFRYVTEYKSSKKGEAITFIQQKTVNKIDSSFVHYFDKESGKDKIVFSTNGICKSVSIDEKGNQIAFLMSTDTGKVKVYDLWYWNKNNSTASNVVDRTNSSMPKNNCVSEFSNLRFSKNGKRLFFGTNKVPEKEVKDTIPDDEKYRLDLWSHTDIQLQPEQLKILDQTKRKNHLAVYQIEKNKMVQLGDSTFESVQTTLHGDGEFAFGVSTFKNERIKSWDFPFPIDYFVINVETGEKKSVLENHKFNCSISTGGNYVVYYKRKENQWYVINHKTGTTKSLTEKIEDVFYEDDNGNPADEDAIGIMGYSESDQEIFIYGKYDIYKINLSDPSKFSSLTNGKGKENKTVYRYENLDDEKDFIPDDFYLLHTFNEVTKKAGYASVSKDKGMRSLIETDHKYGLFLKAKNTETILFTRMNFTTYPNLHLSDLTFGTTKQISDANPQQKEYSWGTVELVHWTSPKGRKLDGLLYKPENFDSRKQYPMLVYFYEKYADDLHNYYSPRPSASIINPTEYASNGYVIFIPDILYNEGSPGEDAYDCIVSGTDHILSLGFVNKDKLGLQGQSWGGYQTAYLVTQTNKYRAAMAGAPVSNMTSAYGGIRWGSGWVRAFQYEKGQSRLGVSLWQDRERYIKNSPLFFADKVETPLLIMHNDQDGAVPWYQGVEYFNALRRLDKKVWMLNYNDDDHNLRRRANQFDLSIRMRQFFDHYLLDKPMPEWMLNGLPAIDKGKKTGYGLIEK